MREHFASLLAVYDSGRIDRRQLLGALVAASLRPAVQATRRAASFRGRLVNHVALSVADVKRSQQFYQSFLPPPFLTSFRKALTFALETALLVLVESAIPDGSITSALAWKTLTSIGHLSSCSANTRMASPLYN